MSKANPTIQSMLIHLTEEAGITGKTDLWPSIQVSLAADKTFSYKRKADMNLYQASQRRGVAAALLLALIVTITLLLVTPFGKVVAQSILRFFTRSEASTMLVPTPTTVSLVAVTPGVRQPTLTPTPGQPLKFASQCGEQSFPRCSLDQIRSLASFKVLAIADGPVTTGLDFVGATGGPDQVWLVYRSKDLTQSIFLLEGTKVEQGFQGFKIASDTTVEEVQVGEAAGEYARGNWKDASGKGELAWDPSQPAQFLRWSKGGIYYEINAFSNPDDKFAWSGKPGLVLLAASLTSEAPSPTPAPVNDRLSIEEAEALAGFHLLVPDKLPRDEWTFSHASYSPSLKTACLVYRHPHDYGASLSIAESASTPFPRLEDLFPPDPRYGRYLNAETLKVGGGLGGWGLLIKGSLNTEQFCVGNVSTPVGSYSPESEVLQIESQGIKISIYAKEFPSIFERNFVTRLEMIRLAESMTGVHTVPDDQLDPEYLQNVEDAEAFAGFPIQMPTRLFPGEAFSYFRVVSEGLSRRVLLTYEKNLSISETFLPSGSLDAMLKADPKAYQKVTVRGLPGLLNAEPGNTISIVWFEQGIEYVLYGVYDGQPFEAWLAIAESMQ